MLLYKTLSFLEHCTPGFYHTSWIRWRNVYLCVLLLLHKHGSLHSSIKLSLALWLHSTFWQSFERKQALQLIWHSCDGCSSSVNIAHKITVLNDLELGLDADICEVWQGAQAWFTGQNVVALSFRRNSCSEVLMIFISELKSILWGHTWELYASTALSQKCDMSSNIFRTAWAGMSMRQGSDMQMSQVLERHDQCHSFSVWNTCVW